VVYADPAAAIAWLCDAFGFTLRLKVEGPEGRIEHCELEYADGLIMVAGERPEGTPGWRGLLRSPRHTDGRVNQSIMIYVDDVDAHCARARRHGATILEEPLTQDYGPDYWSDRGYAALDPEGHLWWISQRLRSPAKGSTPSA
jgi:uncharacterized glyoxalase superfamily protein PhnB